MAERKSIMEELVQLQKNIAALQKDLAATHQQLIQFANSRRQEQETTTAKRTLQLTNA